MVWNNGSRLVRSIARAGIDPGHDLVVAGDGQMVAEPALMLIGTQLGVVAVELVTATPAAGIPTSSARSIISVAGAGLVA